jgi:hypothetical protein
MYFSIKLSRASRYRSLGAEALSMIILLAAITAFLVEGPPIFPEPWFWYVEAGLRRAGFDFLCPMKSDSAPYSHCDLVAGKRNRRS